MILSDTDKLSIRSAIKNVTDSFFVTPILYMLASTGLDRFNEGGETTFIDYTLNGLVEYQKSGGTEFKLQGAINKTNVTVTLNVEDLIALSLFDTVNFNTNLTPEKDLMVINGSRYKVKDVSYDGPLDRQNILVIITGEMLVENS